MAKKFTKDMTIKEALELNKDVEAVLMGFGMHCFHCPMSIMETLEEAGSVHGADIDLMLQKLNELNETKPAPKTLKVPKKMTKKK